MPLHEFQCRACGSQFEELVRSAPAHQPCPACPACGGGDVVKLMSAASLCGMESGNPASGFDGGMGGGCGGGGGGFS